MDLHSDSLLTKRLSRPTWTHVRELALATLLVVLLVAVGTCGVLHRVVPSNEGDFLEAMGAIHPTHSAFSFVVTLPFVLFLKESLVFGAGLASLVSAALLFLTLFFAASRIGRERTGTYWDELAALVACLTFAFTPVALQASTLPGARPLLVLLALSPLLASILGRASSPVLGACAGIAVGTSPLVGSAAFIGALLVRGCRPKARTFLPAFFLALGTALVPSLVLADRRAFAIGETSTSLGALARDTGPIVLLFIGVGLVTNVVLRFKESRATVEVDLSRASRSLTVDARALFSRDRELRVLAILLGVSVLVAIVPSVAFLRTSMREGAIAKLALVALAPLVFARALVFVFRMLAGTALPYARTSAGFLVLLTLAVPLSSGEAALRTHAERRRALETDATTYAYSEVPKGALVFLSSDRVHLHLLAARTAGALSKDAELIRIDGGLPHDLLLPDETLREVLRDLVFEGRLRELALTKLSEARPVFLVFDGSYDRAVARHLAPSGLLDHFHSEPRAPSDRKVALASWKSNHDALVAAMHEPLAHREFTPVFEPLLESRMTALRLVSDRETLFAAAQDLTAVNPESEFAKMIVEKGDPTPVREPPARAPTARVTTTR